MESKKLSKPTKSMESTKWKSVKLHRTASHIKARRYKRKIVICVIFVSDFVVKSKKEIEVEKEFDMETKHSTQRPIAKRGKCFSCDLLSNFWDVFFFCSANFNWALCPKFLRNLLFDRAHWAQSTLKSLTFYRASGPKIDFFMRLKVPRTHGYCANIKKWLRYVW